MGSTVTCSGSDLVGRSRNHPVGGATPRPERYGFAGTRGLEELSSQRHGRGSVTEAQAALMFGVLIFFLNDVYTPHAGLKLTV